MISSFKIRNITIAPNLVLAPMSGITCSAFRRLIKEINPGCVGYTVSEFLSVEGMTRGSRRTADMMRYREMERPFAIQIFGYDIVRMRDAARMVEDAGADIVDINCGCPAPKVVKRGGGAELMRQPEHLAEIFRETRKAIKIPLTMKMRSGWDSTSLNCAEIAHIAESEGVEAITVHGRTRTQLYHGDAEWDFVQQVAAAVKIPVCGSGDVTDLASAQARLAIPGVAGLYIGRASMYDPFVYSRICGAPAPDLKREPLAILAVVERYIELLREDFPEHCVPGKVKQLVSQMARGHGWRKPVLRAMSLTEQVDTLRQIRAALEAAPALSGALDSVSEQPKLQPDYSSHSTHGAEAIVSKQPQHL